MALAFQSTSVSDADAPAAGILAQSAIRDALTAHPSGAWTVAEEFNSAGNTIHWVVLKNDHTISGVPTDFYVAVGRVTASGQICFMLGEVYTPATHTLSSYAPYSSSTQNQNQILADFTYSKNNDGATASFVLGSAIPGGYQTPMVPQPAPLATMRFISIVEKEFAIIHLNQNSIYLGALTDLIVPDATLEAAVPLAICDLWQNGINFGSLTRHPIDVANAPMQVGYSHLLFSFNNTWQAMLQKQAMQTSIYLHGDRYRGKKAAASELMALMYASSYQGDPNAVAEKVGVTRGKFKALKATTFPFAAVTYDTIVVDGRKHIILQDKGQINGEFWLPYNYYNTTKWGIVADTGVAA